MKKVVSGAVAGLALLVQAAPATAGPTVTVRVEGENATLLERTRVTLPDVKAPGDPCANRWTVAAAIEEATQGNWDRNMFAGTILGETHDFSRNDYWAEWVDTGAGYAWGNGVCTDVMQDGDEALMSVDIAAPPTFSPSRFPLALEGVPAAIETGGAATVRVVAYVTDGTPGTGARTPVEGATVTAGGATATTTADGSATLGFGQPGTVVVKAAKAGRVVSAGERVSVSASPPPAGATAERPADRSAPVASFAGMRDWQRFSRTRAPRVLRGGVTPDPSGLQAVRLSVVRKLGTRCWVFDGVRERFARLRCGGRGSFEIGDRADWSYLLPGRLSPARYTLRAAATDRAGNRSVTKVRIRVRARPEVEVMVVGRRALLAGPKRVGLKARTARVGGRRCAIGRATPLSALAGAGVPFRLTDFGACSRRARDAGSLYVRKIGPDAERGRDGWVYKVGRRSGSAGAADPAGSFGTGRTLRNGQRVLWFWCVKDAEDACQRTLAVSSARAVTPGAPLDVVVRGYDEQGRGVAVEGATVRLGDATAVTGADGSATVTAPATAGRVRLHAEKRGMVRSFAERVRVG